MPEPTYEWNALHNKAKFSFDQNIEQASKGKSPRSIQCDLPLHMLELWRTVLKSFLSVMLSKAIQRQQP